MSPRSPLPAMILIPVANPGTAEELIRLGAAMMDPKSGELSALGIVEVPEGMPLSEGATRARHARRLLQKVLDYAPEGTTIHPIVRIGRHAAEGIIEASAEQEADLIIFGWGGKAPAGVDGRSGPTVFSPTIDEVVRESPADIAVVKQRGAREIKRVLVPVRGGPHAELAIRLARDLAKRFSAQVVVMHVVPKGIGDRALAREQAALDRFVADHRAGRKVVGILREAASVRAAILRESSNHQLVVMGASANPSTVTPDGRFLFGVVAEAVASRAKPTVIVVKTKQELAVSLFDDLRAAEGTLAAADAFVEDGRALPTVVDRWFAENTFHASEFRDVAKLVELKEKQGVTISLGLPALNEEKTIGLVIKRVKGALMDRVPLLDQLVLIDSDSTDRTREIAAELGVPVVRHSRVLPEMGSFVGKGEALWKSLHVLDGDIVAWIDTDIRNIQPRFVHGLLGPLLREPRIQYVKGFYRRPIRQGLTLFAEGGGRVTELMARPLINLFFPELSGIIQPLSGEYAGRRSLLESVPFFTGYGVEIGLLIDIAEAAGLSAIGQVDLERRIHRNQPLANLSQMSFTILQAAISKLEERHRIELLTEVGRGMKVIGQEKDRFNLEVREVADAMRPPMRSVPGYQERRRSLKR